jgi:hypothetical protein
MALESKNTFQEREKTLDTIDGFGYNPVFDSWKEKKERERP